MYWSYLLELQPVHISDLFSSQYLVNASASLIITSSVLLSGLISTTNQSSLNTSKSQNILLITFFYNNQHRTTCGRTTTTTCQCWCNVCYFRTMVRIEHFRYISIFFIKVFVSRYYKIRHTNHHLHQASYKTVLQVHQQLYCYQLVYKAVYQN